MKKRKLGWALLFFVLFAGGMLAVNRDDGYAANQTGTVVVSSALNVRSGAGTTYGIIDTLSNGAKVTILQTQNGWYQVSYKKADGTSATGYVSSSYVALDSAATPTPTQASTSTPQTVVSYRTETTYQPISVAAATSKKVKVYKKAGGNYLKVSKKTVQLAKKKKVTIVGETLKKNKKWFKVKFTYKKKTRTGYIRNIYVKMTLKKKANASIYNLKSAAKVHTKAGASAPYKKISGKIVKVKKGSTVKIGKEKMSGKTKWYRIYFTYGGKTVNGYVSSKFVKLAKTKKTTKVKVTAMSDTEFEKYMTSQGFPDSYKANLRALHQKYPYWQFVAYRPGINWSDAVAAESKLGVNLISNSKSEAWKSKETGAYDAATGKWTVFDGTTWVAASKAAISYYMDPRNFINERTIFMFESLEYQSQYQVSSGINTILKNTPFYGKSFSYKEVDTGAAKTMSYTNAFLAAAKSSGVSPYHLASRVKQEVVTSATTTSIAVTGTNATYPGIYNFYNIGATSSSNPALNGLKWANSGTTYLRPWTDPYRSIVGGAQYIGEKYINRGQNTGYLQKFNLTANQRYEHQYMTNVEAAYSEAIKTKNAYAGTMDSTPLVFSIPIFENMPASACAAPQ